MNIPSLGCVYRAVPTNAYLRRYGITCSDRNALLRRQKHRCAICWHRKTKRSGVWHTDHCHITGRVRRLLCRRCNLAIGMLYDEAKLCRRAALYLEGKHTPPRMGRI